MAEVASTDGTAEAVQACSVASGGLFFFFKIYYVWLCWVFVAACRLSLPAVSGGYFPLQYAGFSLQWLLVVGHGLCSWASAVAVSTL